MRKTDETLSVDLKVNEDDFPVPVLYQSTLDVSWESEGDVVRCNGFGSWVPTADGENVWGKLGGSLSPSRSIELMAAFALGGNLTQINLMTNLTIGIQCWDSSGESSVTDVVYISVYEETLTCVECVDSTHGWCEDSSDGVDYCAVTAAYGEYYCTTYGNSGTYITNVADCVADAVVTSTCTDSDGHLSLEDQYYNIKGIAKDEANSFEDRCIVPLSYVYHGIDASGDPSMTTVSSCNANEFNNGLYNIEDKPCIIRGSKGVVDCTGLDCFLFEGICKDQIAIERYYNCPYGCEDGKCVSQGTNGPPSRMDAV